MRIHKANEFGQAIGNNGELIDLRNNPKLFNGVDVLEFNNEQEKENYFASIPIVWGKENYCQQINDAHNTLYQSLWQARDYKDENEISLYADLVVEENTTERQLEWKQEAISLMDYYLSTVDILYNYFDVVTEETAIPVEEFIQTLPIFNG